MTKNVRIWVRSLMAALISGCAGGIVTPLSVNIIDPADFNFGKGFLKLLAVAAIAAGLHGVIGAAMFLQKSPLPQDDTLDTPKV